MEQEVFISGYCRAMDGSRTVMAVIEDGQLTEVDCDFGTCPHRPNCPIARRIAADNACTVQR